jgi:hypothetical protein
VTTANLVGDLTSDGTKLYYDVYEGGDQVVDIWSSGLDGSGAATIATAGGNAPPNENAVSALLYYGGNLYLECPPVSGNPDPVVCSLPTGGGTPTPLFSNITSTDIYTLQSLYTAGSAGVVLTYVDIPIATGVSNYDFGLVPLGTGGTPSNQYDVPIANASTSPQANSGGGVVVLGSNIVFIAHSPSGGSVVLMTAPLAGGTATTLATLPNWGATYIAADAAGGFIDQGVTSNGPGIYRLSSTGQTTPFQTGAVSGVVPDNPREFVLDATNLYWVEGEPNGSDSVHAKAR